jgi:hypothetical protein
VAEGTTTTTATKKKNPRSTKKVDPRSSGKSSSTADKGSDSAATAPRASKPNHRRAKPHVAVVCLKRSGILKAAGTQKNVYMGRLPQGEIFVDGPYKTVADAARSAGSLRGVQTAESGGRYVVSSPLTTHLAVTVHVVAKCLDARS